jgi:hypothetical protein
LLDGEQADQLSWLVEELAGQAVELAAEPQDQAGTA